MAASACVCEEQRRAREREKRSERSWVGLGFDPEPDRTSYLGFWARPIWFGWANWAQSDLAIHIFFRKEFFK